MCGRLALVALIAIVCGCDTTEPGPPTMAGAWEGNISSSSLSLTAAEHDQEVTGTGTFGSSRSSLAFTVDGTHVYPSVSLTLRISGYMDANFSGEFINDNVIAGTVRGSGFTGQDLDLRRK